MCLQRKPICFLGDGEETLRARFPPSLNPGFPAQTQWSSSTVQTIKHKGKQHRDSKQVQPEWCSTQHVAICHDPLSLSHPYLWAPEYKQQEEKETHSSQHQRIQRRKFYASRTPGVNSCWATPAIHHIMLLATTSFECRAAAGPLNRAQAM